MSKKQRKNLYRIIAALILCVSFAILPVSDNIKLFLFVIPYLIAGYDILLKAFKNIINGRVFDENFLMCVATVGAFAIGERLEAVAVMIFYQIGELFQSIAVGKSRRSIANLMNIRPDTATVLRDGKEITVSPEEVGIGEIIIIKAGEKIPLDGVIIEGTTSVDTSSLTGESIPQDKDVGDRIVSGAVNINGVIKVKVTSVFTDSTVAKILQLVETASEKKAKTENFISRFAAVYTPLVVISAVLLAVIPPLFVGGWSDWIKRALIFLVVSCPCALVVSVPLSFFGGIGGASKKGILIKGANVMEALAKINTFVFDKTGTLTQGKFTVTAINAANCDKERLLSIAYAAESRSNHPIALCIADYCKEYALAANSVTELAGKGLCAEIDGEKYYLGNAALMEDIDVNFTPVNSGTVVFIARKNELLGSISIGDSLKQEAANAIKKLKSLGIRKTVMLTGDNRLVAESVAQRLSIDEFKAELLPDEKVSAVEALIQEGRQVAFVGDGINDAPVLTRADVGFAMGVMGSDAAIEAADVVIMDDKLSDLSDAVRISRRTLGIVKQNIVFSLTVKIAILILSSLGLANMWIGVLGDVGVTVLAILNAMRTLFSKKC